MSNFPLVFHAYGFLVGLAILTSVWIVEWIIKREKLELNVGQLSFITILMGIVGARTYHVVTDWSLYQHASFIQIVAVWNGGLGLVGALIGGAIGLLIGLHFQQQKEVLIKLLDAIALSLPFAQAIGRWGNFFNQELYGLPTRLPWGITIDKQYLLPGLDPQQKYHPLFLYESIQLLLFGICMTLVYKSGKTSPIGSGIFIGLYFIFYAGLRFSLEFLRIETARLNGVGLSFLSIAQWMMVLLFFSGIFFVMRSFRYATK